VASCASPCKHPPPELLDYYTAAYDMWLTVWTATFREVDGHDGIARTIGFVRTSMWRSLKARAALGRRLSTGSTSANQRTLRHRGSSRFRRRCSIFSYDPDIRWLWSAATSPSPRRVEHDGSGRALKNLLFAQVLHRMLESRVSVMLGVMRRERGMTRLAEMTGGTVLRPRVCPW